MVSTECLRLLQHPLTKAWLKYKWHAYACWIFWILMAIRAFSIAMLVWLLYSIKVSLQLKKKGEEGLPPYSLVVPPVLLCLMLVSILMQLLVEVNSWFRLRLENNLPLVLVRLASFLLTLLTLLFAYGCVDTCDEMVTGAGILALVLAGLYFIFFVDQLPFFNLLSSITRDFLFKYLKGLACVICIVTLFAFIFHMLLWDEGDEGEVGEFETMANSVLSIALWYMGDFNREMLFKVKKSRVFLHTLFIMYLITFGALIVTIITAPSITKDESLLNKEIGTINLLFEIDVCFPWLRKVCNGNQSGNKKKPGIWAKLEDRLGLRDKASVGSKYQRHKSLKENEGESDNHAHYLLLGKIDALTQDIKDLQCQIRLFQRTHH